VVPLTDWPRQSSVANANSFLGAWDVDARAKLSPRPPRLGLRDRGGEASSRRRPRLGHAGAARPAEKPEAEPSRRRAPNLSSHARVFFDLFVTKLEAHRTPVFLRPSLLRNDILVRLHLLYAAYDVRGCRRIRASAVVPERLGSSAVSTPSVRVTP